MIQLTGLTKRYGAVTALDGVDLTLIEGEILGLLGPNGAGKSTTLRLIGGMAEPTAGQVRVMGLDPWVNPEAVRAQIGVLPEAAGLYDRLSVGQNLALAAGLHQLPRSVTSEAMALTGVTELVRRPVGKLSKGQRQRVALSRALLHRPKLLILDEPTAGLDPAAVAAFHTLVHRLRDEGCTVIISSHDMAEVEALCDRVAILNQGRLVACAEPAWLKANSGQRLLRATIQGQKGIEVLEWPLADGGWLEAVAEHQAAGRLLALQTQEASLAEVFVQMTRRELA